MWEDVEVCESGSGAVPGFCRGGDWGSWGLSDGIAEFFTSELLRAGGEKGVGGFRAVIYLKCFGAEGGEI